MSKQKASYWRSLKGAVSIGLIAVAAYILLIDHSRHLIEWLPLLLLGGCLLMHTMMHGGHSGHADNSEHDGLADKDKNAADHHPAENTDKDKHSQS